MRITLSQKHRMQWPLFTQQCILLNVEYFTSLFGIHVSFICSVYCILMMTHCILICRIDFIALKVCSVYGCGAWLRKAKNYMNVILFSLRSSDGWVRLIRSGVQIDGNFPFNTISLPTGSSQFFPAIRSERIIRIAWNYARAALPPNSQHNHIAIELLTWWLLTMNNANFY